MCCEREREQETATRGPPTSDHDIQVCTPNYRPPDVTLGSQRFQEDLDMWSFGCVAAELYSRQELIAPAATAEQAPSGKDFVDAIAAIVGRPGQEADVDVMPACAASWLDELPFFKKCIIIIPILLILLLIIITRIMYVPTLKSSAKHGG